MAITGSITVGNGQITYVAGQQISISASVSNSGGSDVMVTSIQPTLTPFFLTSQSVNAAIGVPNLGAGVSRVVPAGGSAKFNWTVTPGPSGPAVEYSTGYSYTAGAVVYTSDGAATSLTAASFSAINPGL